MRRKTKGAEPIPQWQEMVDHVHQQYLAKKGHKYPFGGRDFTVLKQLSRYFTAAEIMALYDVYITGAGYWAKQTGFLLKGLWEDRSVLLDDPAFKRLVRYYEGRLGLESAESVAKKLSLTAKSV